MFCNQIMEIGQEDIINVLGSCLQADIFFLQ